jgi:CHAT domain-containing protein
VEGGDYEAQWGLYDARTFLAEVYKDQGEFDLALAIHRQNLDFAQTNPNLRANTLRALAGVHNWQGNYDKAVALHHQVLEVHQQQPFAGLGMAKTLESLGMNLWLAGQPEEAETQLKASVQAYEGQSMQLFGFEPLVDVHRWLAQVLVANQRPGEGLEVSERGRGRLLSALVGQGSGTSLGLQPSIDLERIQAIAQEHNATLVQYAVVYGYRDNQGYRIMWGYDLLEAEALLIWVVQPNGKIDVRAVDPAFLLSNELGNVVERVRVRTQMGRGVNLSQVLGQTQTQLGVEPRSATRGTDTRGTDARGIDRPQSQRPNRHLQKLHQLLIEPIVDLLPTNPQARVIFIPQDSLFSVPFAALQDSQGTYLIEKHTLSTVPSIYLLDLTSQRRQTLDQAGQTNFNSALVVGNPQPMPTYGTYGNGISLNELPGAAQEAQAIATRFQTEPLIGPEATEQAVVQRMPQADLIHFATHGLLNAQAIDTQQQPGTAYRQDLGLDGSLALSPQDDDDGFLTAREIRDLSLQARLVVLSACDTGRGAVRGNGVVGLSSAFLAAGATSLVVSLWQIPDEATVALMEAFYQALQRESDAAVALRSVMLATQSQFPNPRDWAAFVLVGAP